MTTAERFWAKVDVRTPDECWEWTGARDQHGYGRFGLDGRNQRAHQIALSLDGRPLTAGAYACHTCDNKPCVNPRHLYVGDATSNRRDAMEHGQARGFPHPVGDDHPGARLTAAAVSELRARYRAGGITQRLLAAEYGVAQGTISRAITGADWSHV